MSFVSHLRDRAASLGVDLLLIDSGDHHDGTGLVSAPTFIKENGSHPTGGELADRFLAELGYDVLAIGNHELYKYPDSLDVALSAPSRRSLPNDWQAGRWDKGGIGRYLTSNVNITLPSGQFRPIGERVAKFETPMGRRVTSFGILYNCESFRSSTGCIDCIQCTLFMQSRGMPKTRPSSVLLKWPRSHGF